MTDQEVNTIDQMLTRSLKHDDSDAGLFTMHVHFPVNDPAEKVKILDDLANKLIHQHLKKHLVWDNIVSLDTLVNRFKDGEKVMSFDATRSDEDCYPSFRYLSVQDERPIWVDRTGSYIQDAVVPLRNVEPVYLERNVIPQKSVGNARKYYAQIDKFIRRKAMQKGFLLIEQMPQVLMNINGKDAKNFIREHSAFHPKDTDDAFKASLNFERSPLLVLNSSKKASSKSLREKTEPTHVMNLIDLDPNLILREPLSTFGRSNVILHSPSCRSLLTISFGSGEVPDDVVQRINSTFFEIGPYEHQDRSVLIHHDDLNGELNNDEVRIKWINDRGISTHFANIDEILRSSDSILHDILLRSYRLRKLLALSINDTFSTMVLREIFTGEYQLITQYRGLDSYYLSDEHLALLKSLFTQLVASVQRSYGQAGLSIEKFDVIVAPPFVADSQQVRALLPAALQERIHSISQIPSTSSKVLVCDYLQVSELDEHRAMLSKDNFLLAWIEPFFKQNYIRFKRYAIERRLKRYDVQRHVLREKLLSQEKANQERLNDQLSKLNIEPSVTMVDLDPTSGDESAHDPTKYRLELSAQSCVMSGSQRMLIRMRRTKWEVLSMRELFDHFPEMPGDIDIDHIDVRAFGEQLLARDGTQIFDWREKLRAHVAVSSVDIVYQALKDLCEIYDCRMVSKEWFVRDWLSSKGGASIPNQKGLLLALGELLSLDRHVLRTMQIQKLNEKLQQAEINRGLLLLMRYIFNLIENVPPAKYYERARRIMLDDHLDSGYQFFRRFIALSNNDDELVKELIQLMLDAKKNATIKKIKKITKL